jgi:hypothetical protein
MKFSSVSVLCLCLIIFSCKTNEVHTPEDFEGSRLVLSHGGGFAGTYKTYCLLENGQLFKISNDFKSKSPVKGFKKAIAEQIFSNYEILGLGLEKVESYGNLNYSITMINERGEEHKSIWGRDQEGAEKLQLFYNNIMSQIRLNNEVDATKVEVQ